MYMTILKRLCYECIPPITFGIVMASKSSGRTLTFWKRKRKSGLPAADWPPKMSVSPSESSHWTPR